ncbi:MAG: hypothetical protein C4329_08675 [Chitinophagaceae bacterium]
MSATLSHFDGSFIQSVLNQENQQHIRTMLVKLPQEYHGVASANFAHFIQSARVAFSHAIEKFFLKLSV